MTANAKSVVNGSNTSGDDRGIGIGVAGSGGGLGDKESVLPGKVLGK